MLNLHLQEQRTQGLRAEKLAVDSGRGRGWRARLEFQPFPECLGRSPQNDFAQSCVL